MNRQMESYNWEDNTPEKNNFIARILGILGEEISLIWFENHHSEYKNLGRPTIYWSENGEENQATLDFLIKKTDTEGEDYYIVEQKNFFGYRNGSLRTVSSSQEFLNAFQRWSDYKIKTTKAWRIFRQFENFDYKVKTQNVRGLNSLKGAILIWSDVDSGESNEFKNRFGFEDVIGLTRMIDDLNKWRGDAWNSFIRGKEEWLMEIFSLLKAKPNKNY